MVFTQIGAIIFALAILLLLQLHSNGEILNPEAMKLALIVFEGLRCVGLFSYFGQILLDESEFLHDALYGCDWTDKPQSLRRGLLIMQTVATKPLKLTSGGIYTLNMETFSHILSATYSYSSLIFSLAYKNN